MIDHFIATHRLLTYVAGACFFALSGYGWARVSPERPLAAISSWGMALFWLAFGLATTRSVLPVGPVLALVVLIAGVVLLARFYDSHEPK